MRLIVKRIIVHFYYIGCLWFKCLFEERNYQISFYAVGVDLIKFCINTNKKYNEKQTPGKHILYFASFLNETKITYFSVNLANLPILLLRTTINNFKSIIFLIYI